ncbi:MAG TPA: Flp pilus assembly protein CpaB, partial [Dongiaceae bacterium]|nr:Flp pilus assembly protein CpaB [Dongiaceae bacterium]
MKVRPLIVLALALAMALAAVFLARSWILGQSARPTASVAPAEIVQVVAAATALKFGDRLAKENLRLVNWPAGSVPDGTFKSIDELLGQQQRVVLQAIQPNELILASKVTGPGQRASLSAVIASGMRAMTIRVNDVLGVAGFV